GGQLGARLPNPVDFETASAHGLARKDKEVETERRQPRQEQGYHRQADEDGIAVLDQPGGNGRLAPEPAQGRNPDQGGSADQHRPGAERQPPPEAANLEQAVRAHHTDQVGSHQDHAGRKEGMRYQLEVRGPDAQDGKRQEDQSHLAHGQVGDHAGQGSLRQGPQSRQQRRPASDQAYRQQGARADLEQGKGAGHQVSAGDGRPGSLEKGGGRRGPLGRVGP